MKIAIISSEVVPFSKTGGLADVAGALPLALERLGEEVIILTPFYKNALLADFKTESIYPGILLSKIERSIKVYFIQNDEYFSRSGLYGTQKGDYPDNLERFSFFSRACLELLKQIKFRPDIVHIHDWQASCIPIYLKTKFKTDPFYKNSKTLLTIHNLAYQGIFAREDFPKLGLDWSIFNMEQLEFYGKVNILKGGIVFSDCINTVSPTYAREIQTKDYGCGLEGVLSKRQSCLFGIINGLDYSVWNPATDNYIYKRYDINSLDDKDTNKKDLQKCAELAVENRVPLLGMVSRLAEQKGLDILTEALDEICKLNMQLIILGTGDIKYHKLLQEKNKKYSGVFRLFLKFDNALAHKIYAGSDIFLMPSKYEPCGLGQMISLKYGTIPLVYKTGGLADTINKRNGFIFDNYASLNLIALMKESISLYRDKRRWQGKIKEGMSADFSWNESAKKYTQLYKRIIER
jgi:starch synthase